MRKISIKTLAFTSIVLLSLSLFCAHFSRLPLYSQEPSLLVVIWVVFLSQLPHILFACAIYFIYGSLSHKVFLPSLMVYIFALISLTYSSTMLMKYSNISEGITSAMSYTSCFYSWVLGYTSFLLILSYDYHYK
jgi:Na+-translocating ferredoxin:NAD+ oxidoreductase RnfD subunit